MTDQIWPAESGEEYRHPGADYRKRLPASIIDPATDSRGESCTTPVDRRWLWRLELFLAASGTTPAHRQMQADLQAYLQETCEHHPVAYGPDSLCMWCSALLAAVTDVAVTP